MVRKDHSDHVFLNRAGKYRAVVNEILLHTNATSRYGRYHLDRSLRAARRAGEEAGIPHEVSTPSSTSARRRSSHNAGRPKAVTIATNMAGRGTTSSARRLA